MGMRSARWAIIAALLGTVLLAGCREEEQGRVLSFEPGVYQGKPDTPLSDDVLERLRERGRQEVGAFQRGLSAGLPSSGLQPTSDPPPAASPSAADKSLSQRLQHQSF